MWFLISGDPDQTGWTDIFGGPAFGGSWHGPHSMGMSSAGSNGQQRLTLSVGHFDPTIGAVREREFSSDNRYGRVRGPQPPVEVPPGKTLEMAEREVEELKEKMRTMAEETAASIAVSRNKMRLRLPRDVGRQNFRMERANQRQLEAKLELELSLLRIDLTKLRRIIEELGGDPDAKQKAIGAARLLFICNVCQSGAVPPHSWRISKQTPNNVTPWKNYRPTWGYQTLPTPPR